MKQVRPLLALAAAFAIAAAAGGCASAPAPALPPYEDAGFGTADAPPAELEAPRIAAAEAPTTVYVFPARPPGWDGILWPRAAFTPIVPSGFSEKQRQAWGDAALDVGALRVQGDQWQIAYAGEWRPFDPADFGHLGTARMYYRYGLHSWRGQRHEEGQGMYGELSRFDPAAWPPLVRISDRLPLRPDERPLEDVDVDRSFFSRVERAWRDAFGGGTADGGGTVSESGALVVSPKAMLLAASPDRAGRAAFELLIQTSRRWAASVQRTGLPPAVKWSIAPVRGTGDAVVQAIAEWPAGVPAGSFDRAFVQVSIGAEKVKTPLLLEVVADELPPPDPPPPPPPPPATCEAAIRAAVAACSASPLEIPPL